VDELYELVLLNDTVGNGIRMYSYCSMGVFRYKSLMSTGAELFVFYGDAS
jgi:hypothetical protein